MSGNNLARAYRNIGRLQEALALNEQILRSRERIFGADNRWTLGSQEFLAEIYWDVGRVDEAFALLEQSLSTADAIFGQDSPYSLGVRRKIAKLTHQSGDPRR